MSVFIHLDKHIFQPGELVNGSLMINCFQPGPVSITVSGIETVNFIWFRTEYYYTGHGKNRRRHSRQIKMHARQTRTVCNETKAASSIAQGQFRLPFSFNIPSTIPNSFDFQYTSETNAKVDYTIIATIPGAQPHRMGVWIEKSVLEPMNFDQIKNKSINKEVKCCCCFSKGNFKIDASFEKDKYINGEDVTVLANIENNTTANGKMIFDANLYVTLTDGFH